MNLFRHPGLMIALFWCAAMVLAPMVAAAGAGPGADQPPGQAPPGQDIGHNNIAPDQGTSPGETGNQTGRPGLHGQDWGNVTTIGNGTIRIPPAGNLTAPPDMPDWDRGNATEKPYFGNETAHPVPPDWKSDNSTAVMNQSWHGPGTGNQSTPVPPVLENGQNLDEQLSAGTLIDELISWLRTRTGT